MFSMNIKKFYKFGLLLICALVLPAPSNGFPPAPDHIFRGMVRDEQGRPLQGDDVYVYIESSAGKMIKGEVYARALPGVNYTLKVPLDAGITEELYIPTAMRPTMPFLMRVSVGNRIYLPIEMGGDLSKMGEPGEETLLNLTLGEDTDGDGLPDAWERALLTKGQGLKDINPNDDTDGDGMSNLAEYISGNYAFDKKDGLRLDILKKTDDSTVLEFLAIRGRTYTVHGSDNLNDWAQMDFRDGEQEDAQSNYRATDIRKVLITVPHGEGSGSAKFFKLMVQ